MAEIALGPRAQAVLAPFLDGCPPTRSAFRSPRTGRPYTGDSYYHAISRACRIGGLPHWHPHQLRHAAATEVRRRFGVEAAQAVLDHERLTTTEVYAERRLSLAAEVAREIG